MPTRLIGIFYAEDTAEVANWLVAALIELLRAGHRVRVVDADPAHGYISRLVSSRDWQGSDFVSLMHHPEQYLRAVDITDAVATQQPERALLELVPVLPAGAPPQTALLHEPPLHGARRFLFLKDRLARADSPLDLVLLLSPPGDNTLALSLLAHGVDAAVFIATGEARQVAMLSLMSRNAEALRGAVIPTLCVEGRDGREVDLSESWSSFWGSDRRFLPPGAPAREGPERLVVLDEDEDVVEWALAMRRLVDVHEPDPAERLREAEAEGWPEVAEAAFSELYSLDPARAMSLFDAEIGPRLGTLQSAVAATRAVWSAPNRQLADAQRCAKYAVQKLRLEAPTPLAQDLLPILGALGQAVDEGQLDEEHGRTLINLAEVLVHCANLRRAQGEPLGDLLTRAGDLLTRAAAHPLRATDHLRRALVWGMHGRLLGSTEHYQQMLDDVRAAQAELPKVRVLRRLVDALIYFAHVDRSLWATVVTLSKELIDLDPHGHWTMAVGVLHQGQRKLAMKHLWHLGQADMDAYYMAWADPDLAPLWEGAGKPDYEFHKPIVH